MADKKHQKPKRKKKTPSQQVPDWVPPFTSSLDAALPDENIVSTQHEETSGKWIAVNRDPDGRLYIGIGNTEPLARRIAGLKALDAQKQRGSTIPAAEIRVGLDHNNSDYKELVVGLDRLIGAINESNEYAAFDPDDRDRQLSELRSAKGTLASSGPIKAGFVAAFASVLTYLGTKFADTLIGNLAETVLDLLQRVLGA